MELIVETPRKADPAPALTRGLELLSLICRDGQISLEALVRKTAWPKSSVWRYLQALEAFGAVQQDATTKLWGARLTLRPVDVASSAAMIDAKKLLPQLATSVHCCTELYSVEGRRICLIDRAEPDDELVALRARIGFERELSELDSTALIFFAFQDEFQPLAKSWIWREGRRHKLGQRIVQMRIQEARECGWALDCDFNENGFRRFSRPVLEGQKLTGILSIVQRQTPLAEREKVAIIKHLKTTL
ncbi:helix-turn-helix domain-containing protein [Cerasicoccus frondis]|uniref:helix-turn-helix domain-containing protein n=1 Tax=Cerasicoccus frondis TaxID=490090 RepID=UPI002852B474|nr:helix-turn-helix domain-containing protein [Cerasicoccus frondis]